MAEEKKTENPSIARLKAKIAKAKNLTQKASLQFQLDVLEAGNDKGAVTKVRSAHSKAKADAAAAAAEKTKRAAA